MTINLTPIILAVITGLCLGGGWWVYVDGVIKYKNFPHMNTTITPPTPIPYHYAWMTPGLVVTFSMVAMNIVTMSHIRRHWAGRLWLFITLTVGVLGLCGAVWILSNVFDGQEWPGVSLVVQTLLILMGGIIYFLRVGFGSSADF
jgi:cytochrome bd-type quinol oxidase subunit 2